MKYSKLFDLMCLRPITTCATYRINATFIHDSPRFDLTSNQLPLLTSLRAYHYRLVTQYSSRGHSHTPLLCRCAFSRAPVKLPLLSEKMFSLRAGRCFEYSRLFYVPIIRVNCSIAIDGNREKCERAGLHLQNKFRKRLTE